MGQRSVAGYLLAIGINTPRANMRTILDAVDPTSIAERTSRPIERRVYYVPFPNSVWHIDGQHKLINWKFVIHGAIDGKSHLITLMAVTSNNWSQTVERLFRKAVEQWGWPNRVRADYGGENVGVQRLMESVRGKPPPVLRISPSHTPS